MKRNGRPFTGFAATLCVLLLTASLMSSADGWYEEGNRTAAGGKPATIAGTVSGNQREEPAEAAPQIAIPPLTLDAIPEYAGEPYAAVNNNIPFFTEADLTADAFERYSALDRLGRCGTAFANICRDTMPTGERGSIGEARPSGWHTVRYDDRIDGRYLYNRCHLIGWRLSGENANVRNLITGTRYLNVIGMLPFEDCVGDYAETSGNHVLYRVTPLYEGESLVPSGVLMEARSVEDDGDGVRFNVFCYNVQPGIIIDYRTGESRRTEAAVENPDDSVRDAGSEKLRTRTLSAVTPMEAAYILNRNTKKFHRNDCPSVSEMSEKNKLLSDANRETIIAWGYVPCKRCKP